MRSSSGEPFRVLVCPIYTCLREVGAPLFFSAQSKRSGEMNARVCVHESLCSFLFLPQSRLQTPHYGLVSGAAGPNAISSRKAREPGFSSHQLLLQTLYRRPQSHSRHDTEVVRNRWDVERGRKRGGEGGGSRRDCGQVEAAAREVYSQAAR